MKSTFYRYKKNVSVKDPSSKAEAMDSDPGMMDSESKPNVLTHIPNSFSSQEKKIAFSL